MRTFTSVSELSLKSAHLRGSAWIRCAGVHHLVTLKTCVPLSAFTPVTQFVSNGHETLAVRQNRKHLILIELDFRLTLTRVAHILLADVVENLKNSIKSCWVQLQSYGLFTLPYTELDHHPGTDIRSKNGYSNDWGSGSELEFKSKSVQWEHFPYSTM